MDWAHTDGPAKMPFECMYTATSGEPCFEAFLKAGRGNSQPYPLMFYYCRTPAIFVSRVGMSAPTSLPSDAALWNELELLSAQSVRLKALSG
jgi:hypothetical protein